MRKNQIISMLLMFVAFVSFGLLPTQAADKATSDTVPVKMTVTLRVIGDNKRTPEVNRDDVIVRQGNQRLQVTGWTPVQGNNAGVDLFILLDESSEPTVSLQFDELRSFINAQPPTTAIGVGYMRHGTVAIAQDFTTDHELAGKALRLPIASSGSFGSPYLSVIDLMNRWPADTNRRQVVMITDGIDRFRGGPRYRGYSNNPDVDRASAMAQKTGTTINTIFTRGVGRLGNNFWEITNGQAGIAKLADDTGGESFYLGTQSPVNFKPYLDAVQQSLDNHYLLEFRAAPGKKAGLQPIKLTTEIAGVELDSANNVWVAAR